LGGELIDSHNLYGETNKKRFVHKSDMTQVKADQYVRMFESPGMPFLITSIALEHYRPLRAIAILRNNTWTTYLPKDVQENTLKEGITLFGDNAMFAAYVNQFNKYKERSLSYFNAVVSKTQISQEELRQFFDLISECWKHYQKTEFFYVDAAFKLSKENKVIADNLKKLENVKNSGREHMNQMIFGSESFLSKALSILSKQFDINIENIFYYSMDEIFLLYDGRKVDKSVLDERRDAYVFLAEDTQVIALHGAKAKEFIAEFLAEEKTARELKGTVANPGKVTGKVKVLIYGPEKFDKVSEFIEEMEKGDVLVAETTSPEIMVACKKASAILTNQGGLLSHAAIVSRELNIPCIVGFGDITNVLKDGDVVEVDAKIGIVKILKKAAAK